MSLCEITIRNFRILESVSLALSPTLNLITGRNASGKTSFLESLHFLSRARSFRPVRTDNLIRHGCESLLVAGRIEGFAGRSIPLGIERNRKETRARLDGQTVSGIAQLTQALPLLALHPESHELVSGGPAERRAYLDWGVFHQETTFLEAWQRYQRALMQRNKSIKTGQREAAIKAWDSQLVEQAERIDRARESYFSDVLKQINDYQTTLLPGRELEIEYRRGWPSDEAMSDVLNRSLNRDREQGFTRYGPHRAELAIRFEGMPADKTASRGQQKLIVALLKIAQAAQYSKALGRTCVFLIDDLPSELDEIHRGVCLEALAELSNQVFVSAIREDDLDLGAWNNIKMFHVEHGVMEELV